MQSSQSASCWLSAAQHPHQYPTSVTYQAEANSIAPYLGEMLYSTVGYLATQVSRPTVVSSLRAMLPPRFPVLAIVPQANRRQRASMSKA
jgi:hypothetical protein